MTVRTIRQTIAFRKPFYLKGVDRLLSPGDYGVVTDEELIEGLSFSAYHRISTVMFVPAEFGCAVEMVTIDPLDLQAAIDRDARERIDDSRPSTIAGLIKPLDCGCASRPPLVRAGIAFSRAERWLDDQRG